MNQAEKYCRTIKRLCNSGGGTDLDTILLLPLNGNNTDYSPNDYAATVHGNPGYGAGYYANTKSLYTTNGNWTEWLIPDNYGTFSCDFFEKCTIGRDVRIGCFSICTYGSATWGGLAIYNSPYTSPTGASIIGYKFVHNTWFHVALTRDTDNTLRLFVNGAYVGQTTSTNNAGARFAIDSGRTYGEGRTEYVSNIRLTKAVLHEENNGVYTYPVPTQLYI